MTGTLVRIVYERGFGFIKPSGDGEDIFFHISEVRPSPGFSFHLLRVGQMVNFEVGDSDRGPRAEHIVDPA